MIETPPFEVLVLSMPSAEERRQRVSAMMEGIGVPRWRFFDVIPAEGLQVAYSDRAAFLAYGSTLSPAEISCAASHIGMMEAFLADETLAYLVVIEDDVFIDPHFDLGAAVRFMAFAGLGYMKLYARYFVPARYIAGLGRLTFYRPSWPSLGTQAYVLSRDGARRMVAHLKGQGELSHPIDASMDRFWETELPIVMPYPFPVMELALKTTIHDPSSRAKIADVNAALRATLGPAPKRLSRLKDTVRRKLADRRLTSFDAALRARIEGSRRDLNDLFRGK